MKRVIPFVLCLSAACTGLLDNGVLGPAAEGHPIDGDDLASARAPLCGAAARDKRGPRVMRRLTKNEFETSIRRAFGFDTHIYPTSDLPPDPAAANGLTNQADLLLVTDGIAERLLSSAERVAALVVSEEQLPRILPCAANVTDECAATFLDTVGQRLFRRPLTALERTRYLELRDTVAKENGQFVDWIRWATVAMVSSPNMVYRSELGDDQGDGSYSLTPYERATQLAFTFTGAPPDDALLAAAKRGDLDTPAGMERVAKTLVLDETGKVRPEFGQLFRRFVSQWLGLSALGNRDKDLAAFPTWNPEVRAAMGEEIDRFVEHVVFEKQGGIEALLTAPYTLLNGTLREYYGYGTATGAAFELTERPANWGVGLLSQGALLALKSTNRDTSPTQRGHFVRSRILCYEVPPPPPTVGNLPPPTAANTTRERYEDLHAANSACASCHHLMDPIGFAFEHLDAAGRFRELDNGFPIDDSAYIAAVAQGEKEVPVEGPTELASELANRESAGACLGAFFASFSFGFDQQDSACLVSSAREKLASGDLSVLGYFTAITTAPHFAARVDE